MNPFILRVLFFVYLTIFDRLLIGGIYLKKWMLFLVIFILTGCGDNGLDNPINEKVQNFTAINQNQEEVTLNTLQDKLWIANFIFTNCETVCPPMTAHLKTLQEDLKDRNISLEIISFSVDPTVDTPQKLKEFIEKYDADQSTWQLLTGYSQDFINHFAMDSFQTLVDKPNNTSQVIHGTRFYLIDKEGIVKKSYDGVQNVPYEEIINDIQILQNK